MNSGGPWSIRGIDEDIRDAARAAARRSGLTVSEWLNDLIARQAAAEGVAPARTRREPDPRIEADAVAEAVQRLMQRIRAMDVNSREALSGLEDRFDEIESRLGAAARSGGRGGERARSLGGVASMVDQLSREIDNADETARSQIEGLPRRAASAASRNEPGVDRVAAAIRDLDARISAMSTTARPAPEEAPANLDTIKARLETLLAQNPERPAGRAATLDATLRSLESHIDQARERLAGAQRRPAALSAAPDDRAGRIEERLADITGGLGERRHAAGREASGTRDFASAVAEISARQRTIDDRADYATLARGQRRIADSLVALQRDIAALVDRIAHAERSGAADKESYTGLADRIDALAADLPNDREILLALRADLDSVRTTLDGDAGIARLDAVSEELAAIRRALEGDDSPKAITRLEMRVAELARATEAALGAAKAAAGRGDSEAVGRLESRLDDVAGRIDHFLGRAATADAVGDLQRRFKGLLDRLDRMDAGRQDPTVSLNLIRSEIAAVRREIAGREPPKIDHLEEQVAELASRLETVAQAEPEGPALVELEAQVVHLASELERSMPRTAALKQVEENLARLQGFLADSRDQSVEAARSAAREAVRQLADAPGDSDLVRALKGDLENIRAAATDADQRTQETLGSVHETLARVVERLTRLEEENVEPLAVAGHESERATGTYGAETPVPRTGPGAAIANWAGTGAALDDNRPLEPGTGKPDLAALRELARSATEGQRDSRGDRRADFIAAARRAAQAAARQAAPDDDDDDSDERPGAFARIGQAIRNRRRPLLLAAAALVLAISAIHLFSERGVKTLQGSPDRASIERPSPDLAAAPMPVAAAAESTPAPTVPRAREPALVAPNPDINASIAFAAPEAFDSRFGSGPASPSTAGFTAPEKTAAGATMAALEASAPSAPVMVAPMPEAAVGPVNPREAAAAGDPSAAFEVAARYAEGQGRRQDLAKAAEWYGRAAEAGVAVAQYRLGSLYERGHGIAKDPIAAVTWYQRAADQGNVGAMHNLAVMMSEGVDGAPDHDKAFEWFLAAANYGVKDSQYNLGVIYARGLGPAQDLVESYKWFAVAAASGDADAAARRDEVGNALSPDDLARARAAVQAWRATPAINEANSVATPPGGWEGASEGVTEADRRSLVKKIQTLLAEQGYDPGPLDGFEGPKTREAVKAYQRKIGVATTGQINRDLVATLVSPST